MSSDDPTRRLDPIPPQPPPRREVVYTDAEELRFREDIRDRLRSLTTAVVVIGVLSVIALGVALWALLSQNDENTGGGNFASKSSVQSLRSEVDDLSDQVRNGASKQDVQQLGDKVDALDNQVSKLNSAVSTATDDIAELRQDVDDLQQRVDALEQSGTTAPPP